MDGYAYNGNLRRLNLEKMKVMDMNFKYIFYFLVFALPLKASEGESHQRRAQAAFMQAAQRHMPADAQNGVRIAENIINELQPHWPFIKQAVKDQLPGMIRAYRNDLRGALNSAQIPAEVRERLPDALGQIDSHVQELADAVENRLPNIIADAIPAATYNQLLTAAAARDQDAILQIVNQNRPQIIGAIRNNLPSIIDAPNVSAETRASVNLIRQNEPQIEQALRARLPALAGTTFSQMTNILARLKRSDAALIQRIQGQLDGINVGNNMIAAAGIGFIREYIQQLPDTVIERSEAEEAELNELINNLPQMINEIDYPSIVRDALAEQREQKRKAEEEKRAQIKWQNTLVWATGGAGLKLGLYNADLLKLGLFGANIATDMLIYKKLQSNRIAKTFNAIKTDYNIFIEELEKYKKALDAFDKEYYDKGFVGKLLVDNRKRRKALSDPLRKYLQTKHALISGYNPFKNETLVPLLLRFATKKATEFIEDHYLITGSITDPRSHKAYIKNEQGQLVEQDRAPFSVITLIKWGQVLINPFSGIANIVSDLYLNGAGWIYNHIRPQEEKEDSKVEKSELSKAQNDKNNDSKDKLSRSEKLFHGGISFLYSPTGKNIAQFIGLGLGAKMYDDASSDIWSEYVISNLDKLLELLQQYKTAKETFKDDSVIKEVDSKIKKFIDKGLDTVSFVPGRLIRQWWAARNTANYKLALTLALPATAYIGYKVWQWFNEIKSKANTVSE